MCNFTKLLVFYYLFMYLEEKGGEWIVIDACKE